MPKDEEAKIKRKHVCATVSFPPDLLELVEDAALENKRLGAPDRTISAIVRRALESHFNRLDEPLPSCPFCGSTGLNADVWRIEDEKVDVVECDSCQACAPLSIWKQRHHK